MSAHDLISRLDKCKQTSASSWIARCPAHEDRSPSLTITAVEDGRVLIHCFGGCTPLAVLEAVGLTFEALFPEPLFSTKGLHYQPRRLRFNARDVLSAVGYELMLCHLYLSDRGRGEEPMEEDTRRFKLALERIEEARRYAKAS